MERLIVEARSQTPPGKVDGLALRKAFVTSNGKEIALLRGKHLLSLGDVVRVPDLCFLLQMYRPDMTRPDATGSTGFHYAAEYDVDSAFENVPDKARLYTKRKSDGHSALSLLIAKNKVDVLRSLRVDPFASIRNEVHHNWLHEAISTGASKVVLYLLREHRSGLAKSLLTTLPSEVCTPFDLLLSSEHLSKAKRNLYVDRVLSQFPGGLRLKRHTAEQFLKYCAALNQLSSFMSPADMIGKCARDCIITH